MDPEFDRRASRVVRSPYWSSDRADLSDQERATLTDRSIAFQQALSQALTEGGVESYEDLTGDVKKQFDAAEKYADDIVNPPAHEGEHLADYNLRMRMTEPVGFKIMQKGKAKK